MQQASLSRQAICWRGGGDPAFNCGPADRPDTAARRCVAGDEGSHGQRGGAVSGHDADCMGSPRPRPLHVSLANRAQASRLPALFERHDARLQGLDGGAQFVVRNRSASAPFRIVSLTGRPEGKLQPRTWAAARHWQRGSRDAVRRWRGPSEEGAPSTRSFGEGRARVTRDGNCCRYLVREIPWLQLQGDAACPAQCPQ